VPSPTVSSPSDISERLLHNARRLLLLEQQVYLARLPRTRDILNVIQKARIAKEKEWWTALMSMSSDLIDRFQIALAHQTGSHLRDKASVSRSLELGVDTALWVRGGTLVYLQLAIETAAKSGQLSLEQLGLGETFAWAHPRAMAQDMYAVRGSKVIQNLYGYHLDKLTDIIFKATNPTAPLTLREVEAAIHEEWPALTRAKVAQIARTETAAVWTHTQMNAFKANGVQQFRSIVASGPSIGPNATTEIQQSSPCPICVDAAASVYSTLTFDLPPWHPSCRCTAIPVLTLEDGSPWLPPDEPWTGGLSDDLTALEDF
jgi:phage baseplate assembly protein W